MFGVFGIHAEHVVTVKLILEANGDIYGAVIDLERVHVASVASDRELYGRLIVICIGRNNNHICHNGTPVVTSFARSNGEFNRD